MRRQVVLAALTLLVISASSAFAGRIFGDIKQDGKPIAEGLRLTITAPVPEPAKGETAAPEAKPEAKGETPKPKPAAVADTTATDKFGSYKVTVKDEGKCTLTLVVDKQPVSLEVFSYKTATRYDLILEKKDGKLTLRRK
jgi:hypothetical protein